MKGNRHIPLQHASRLALAGALALGAMNADIAAAAKSACQYHSAQVIQTSFTVVEPTPPGYIICFSGLRVVGTLNGESTSCAKSEAFIGEGTDNIWTNAFDTTIETADGTLSTREYDIVDYDQFIFTSLSKVLPESTGKFAGATGTLIGTIELLHNTNPRDVLANIRVTGYICSPAP